MQAKICHPDVVDIRVAKRDAKLGTVFHGVSFFASELFPVAVYYVSTHKKRKLRE
jgi:hypothetical protein